MREDVWRTKGVPTSSTVTPPKPPEGFGRLAAAFSPAADAGTRLQVRLNVFTIATRWITILAGVAIGATNGGHGRFFPLVSVVLVAYTAFETLQQLRFPPLAGLAAMTTAELVLTIGAAMMTGGFKSPYIMASLTGLLLAGYVWGRRATVGTIVAGVIAAGAAIAIQSTDTVDRRSAATIAVVFLLCGALGAFTRNLVVELQAQHAAALDQATQMATANELLVSLHSLAQTLPASFDLGEVVESIRQRVRALFPYTGLVVLVVDDGESGWRVELSEGVRVGTRLLDAELPTPAKQALASNRVIVVNDRVFEHDDAGFVPLTRSGIYRALRARGALVGVIAIEHEPPDAYGDAECELLESLSGVLALSLDNARWFGRLHTLGAEAERGRIARELHDRIAQSLAYVTFELERLQTQPGDKQEELGMLHDVVRDIVRELRETIYQLRANVTEDTDFAAVAADYLTRFEERTGIRTRWSADTARRLPYRVEQELWRIVQEALANVDRHAGANEVLVRWELTDESARLEISDDGRGFDPTRVEGDHYGIVGMRERADAIGARLAILSREGVGTSVVVELEPSAIPRRQERRSA